MAAYFLTDTPSLETEQISGPTAKPYEVSEFASMLGYKDMELFSPYGLERHGQVILTWAPARLDVMGGIADYCGANVFELTLQPGIVAGCQARSDRQLRTLSIDRNDDLLPGMRISLDEFYTDGNLKSYATIRHFFAQNPDTAWAAYVLGGFYVLLKEKKIDQFPHGAAVTVKSSVQMGVGISSSAALEVAALTGINHLYGLNLDALEIARLAHIVENRVVGVPCGIVDQITVAAGEKGKVLSILCQPGQILETVPLPPNTQFIGINSRVERSTSSSAYIDARTAAFMGLTILQKELGLPELQDNYLCKLSVLDFRQKCWKLLPKRMKGEDFLDQYGESVDTATQIEPHKTYPIRSRVEHPIYEHARVQQFIQHIKAANTDPENRRRHLMQAGRLMYASNWSYHCRVGLGSPQVQQIVRASRKIGMQSGFYGAKITGSGGGGTVAVLCHGDVSNALIQVTAAYKLAWGIHAEVFTNPSPGAFEFGHVVIQIK